MPVRDIARTDIVSVDPEATAEQVADRMRDEQVGSVVVTEGDSPVGLVTDRDLGLRLWESEDPADATARDLMTEDLVTADPDAGIYDALGRLEEANVRRLLLVDGDELSGIVSLDDFVVLLAGEFDRVSDVVQAESPPY